ncbi:MAG: hypothetical protein ACRCYR_16735 [Phycicoccus sp.]
MSPFVTVPAYGVGHPRTAVTDRAVTTLATGSFVVWSVHVPLVAPVPAARVTPVVTTLAVRRAGRSPLRGACDVPRLAAIATA